MIDTFQIFEELKKDFPESTAKKLTDILSRIYVELANTVTKEDFRGLKEIIEDLINTQKFTEKEIIALKASIAELSEAQRKTEERVRELAEAQKKTEERLNEFERRTEENFQRVWKSIAELSEAQKRTEERVRELVDAQKRAEERLNEFERRTEENFQRVWKSIAELSEAQKRTEERVNELAEAQKKTEERVNKLAEAQRRTEERLNELAEAQKRTEERLNELAEAQKRTEEKLNELAEAQKKTEERVNKLAEAQRRAEGEIEKLRATVAEIAEDLKRLTKSHLKLVEEHRKTREQLGGLSHAVGYLLEDRAYVGLPPLLKKDFNLEIIEPLKRDYIETSPGVYEEVNIIGKGKINGKEVFIIGECKTQLKKKDVDKFLSFIKKLSKYVFKDIIGVLVTYQTSPKVKKYVKEKGIKLYFSYEFPLV